MPATERAERVGPEAFDGVRFLRPGRAVVAFLAEWCPFCRAFEPEFLRPSQPGSVPRFVADVTSEESPLWDRFGIQVVPTVIVFEDGRAVLRRDGVAGEGLGAADLRAIEEATRRPRGAPGRPGEGRASPSRPRRRSRH